MLVGDCDQTGDDDTNQVEWGSMAIDGMNGRKYCSPCAPRSYRGDIKAAKCTTCEGAEAGTYTSMDDSSSVQAVSNSRLRTVL